MKVLIPKNLKQYIRTSKKTLAPLLRQRRIRVGLLVGAVVLLGLAVSAIIRPYFTPQSYELGSAGSLLPDANQSIASKLKYDSAKQLFTFNGDQAATTAESVKSGTQQITATAYQDPKKGLSVTDPINKVDFNLTPKFNLGDGRQDSNRIVYPLADSTGWAVYTMQATGVKEDILLTRADDDTKTLEYTLGLGDGLDARLEADGSIGVYGNTLFSGDVSTGSDADAALLVKARQNATKDTFLFNIPKPVIVESGNVESSVKARYSLDGATLKVIVTGLKQASYPLSIDPSIYVVTAQQFMQGNNETNINFDVDNKLIQKSPTTGARFDSWKTTTALPSAAWGIGTAAAGGYVYAVGGTSSNGQVFNTQGTDTFTVPAGITSITVKMWGGGAGGGGGGNGGVGANGGGSGYVSAILAVTPGEILNIYVGGGGSGGIYNASGADAGGGGGGGGYSTLLRGSTPLALASGGGGGGGARAATGGGDGGAGGGTTGVTGDTVGNGRGGTGGTQSTGGTGGLGGNNNGSNGSSLAGGAGADGRSSQGTDGSGAVGGLATGGDGGQPNLQTTRPGAGGGGSGYFGGGGGGSTTSANGNAGGGGGGGSSYTVTGATGVTNTAGSGMTPGNAADSYRNGAGDGAGGGISRGQGQTGANGLIAVTYGSGSLAVSQTVSWAKFNTTTGSIDSTNPGSGTCSGWCTTSAYNLPSARSNFSLVTYNGFLYAIGGIDSNGVRQNTVYTAKIGANGEPQLWHPTDTNKNNWVYWYQGGDLSSVRSDASVVAYNNRMYLVGGRSTSGPVNTVEIADINPTGTLSSWSSATTLPYNLYSHSAQVYNDRLYILGGASSVGGAPLSSVYYNKINNNGTLNNWNQTSSMATGRMANGGNLSVVWGAYIYISGGCSTVNASGYCTAVSADTQVASINADGSLDVWNNLGGVSNQRTGFGMIAWRNNIYEIGGCSSQNTSTGDCNGNMLDSIIHGTVNQDGDASTVDQSVASGTAPCSGGAPVGCNLPGATNVGNMLSAAVIANGYLYVIGGCTNNTCSTTSEHIAYVAISSTGTMTKPATCPTGTYQGGTWCVDTTNVVTGGIAASSPVVFGNRLYLVGGLDGGGNTNTITRSTINDDGSLSSWTPQSMTGLGVNSVSYLFAYARANPSAASTNPGNLYVFGGCSASSAAGCTNYSEAVYKCNIQTNGAIAGCTTTGQQQIGRIPGASQNGLGIMSGTVYANYIYLIGGVAQGQVDLKTLRYAEFDNNNNVISADGSGTWVQSANEMVTGRRRAAAFGYNGYIYVVGGYEAAAGVLADIEFIKVNVSDGSLGNATQGFSQSAVTINQRWGLSVPVSNSYAYVIGGCTVGTSPGGCTTRTDIIQTFQLYNNDSGAPAEYSASANTYNTNPSRIGASSVVLNGSIYTAGGCTGTVDCTAATDNVSYAQLDANGNVGTWTSSTAPLPTARAWGKLEAAGGSLYYIGGEGTQCTPTGESRFERYNGINGTAVSDLYGNANFPNNPSSSQTLTGANLSGLVNVADNFGGRLSAVICAPQTGAYTFWISSDDSSELRLSTDSTPANVSAKASVNGWTNPNSWTTYGSQQSATVTLQAGKSYYIEANYKEGGGGDHVEIGWQLPDGTMDRPISNSHYTLPGTTGPSIPQSSIYYGTPVAGNVTSWGTATNSLPAARTNFGSTVWNNRLYVVGGEGSGAGCTNNACNTVYVSPQLNSGGNITSAWSTASTPFNVGRSGTTAIAYANNLYIFGGYDGTNYLSDSQYTQLNTASGQAGAWTYSASLPGPLSQADGFAANGYMYLIGGRSDATTCDSTTLVAPISANTTIASGNNPTGIGEWYKTNQRYSGARYGGSAVYSDGKAYVLGGACGSTLTYASPVIQQTALLSQPQVAKYSIMIDTDSDVFPTSWLLNGVDNSIGAKWQLKYRSMTNTTTLCTAPAMTTWGSDTNFGNVTLGLPGIYVPVNGSGATTNCARFYYFNVTVDSSQAFGYPDDVTRGPTITDLTLQFTADPSKRLMHGRTFTGGLQQPIDTPYYTN